MKEVSFAVTAKEPPATALPRATRNLKQRTFSGLHQSEQDVKTGTDSTIERMALKSANDLISKYYLCPPERAP